MKLVSETVTSRHPQTPSAVTCSSYYQNTEKRLSNHISFRFSLTFYKNACIWVDHFCFSDVLTESAAFFKIFIFIMCCLAFLLVILDLLAADGCDIYGAVGQKLELPFIYDKLDLFHVLRWTHNRSIVFYRQQSRVSTGNATDVSPTGSLTLNNLQFSSSGEYKADVLDRNNKLVATWSRRVCVIDRVSKPQLSSLCDFQASALHLNCHVDETYGVTFSWAIDGKLLPRENKQKLSISFPETKAGMRFMCSAANAISKENSDIVSHVCTRTAEAQADKYCYRLQTVQAVFAGGAGLVLLLLIIIIALCCCRQKQRPLEARDREEFRMQSTRKVHKPGSVSTDYENVRSSVKAQGQNSEQNYLTVPQSEEKSANRLSHHSVAEGGERSSPVPKPRTKSPQMANV